MIVTIPQVAAAKLGIEKGTVLQVLVTKKGWLAIRPKPDGSDPPRDGPPGNAVKPETYKRPETQVPNESDD